MCTKDEILIFLWQRKINSLCKDSCIYERRTDSESGKIIRAYRRVPREGRRCFRLWSISTTAACGLYIINRITLLWKRIEETWNKGEPRRGDRDWNRLLESPQRMFSRKLLTILRSSEYKITMSHNWNEGNWFFAFFVPIILFLDTIIGHCRKTSR